MSIKQAVALLKQTYSSWSDHQAPRLGASVAFYSILSFAPMLVLITAVIAVVFGHDSAQGALINEARQLMGDRGAETVNSLLKNAQKPASGVFAGTIAFATLLFGASGVFTELQNALNTIWDLEGETATGVLGMVKQRLFSFGMVLSVGFLLLVSLILSAGLAYIGHSFSELVPVPSFILLAVNFLVSFAVVATLFALIFRYVPATKVPWSDVRVGAIGTALLFTVGKLLLGLYLGKASVGSTYGAAGSLVAFVVWIYYSAQIFFFGAEFTHLYAEAHGSKEGSSAASTSPKSEATPAQTQKSDPVTAPLTPALSEPSSLVVFAEPEALPVPSQETPLHAVSSSHQIQLLAEDKRSLYVKPGVRLHRAEDNRPQLLISLALGFVLGRASQRLVDGKTHPPLQKSVTGGPVL